MTGEAATVLREALRLPLDERAEVATELLSSLDDGLGEEAQSSEAAWRDELERRATLSRSGDSGVEWSELRDQLRSKLAE